MKHPPRPSVLPLILASAFVAAFVLAPIVAMLFQTVHDGERFSLAPWREVLRDPVDRLQMAHTLALGALATAIAVALGGGHAWLCVRTDLPGGRWLGPLGVAPLVVPPVLTAMGFADFADMRGFLPCAFLLGVCYAPFVAVLGARGLRGVDGRAYEAALLARGRGGAARWLLRSIAPELAAGALLAFVFVVSEHGLPEFLTVKGKVWHTYAEGIFSRWTRRALGVEHVSLASPIVAAVPLVIVIAIALAAALRLRAAATRLGDAPPLPIRRLGAWRLPALLVPIVYLGAGVGVPVVVMGAWAAGSTQRNADPSAQRFVADLRLAVQEAGDDLARTVWIGALTTAVLLAVALPLAHAAARRLRFLDALAVLPVAVPGVLLAIGLVRVFNRDLFLDFYDSDAMLACAYASRFLPFAVLTLSSATRRVPRQLEEAAALTGRGALARAARVHVPLMLPAAWSAACLVFFLALRELDVAVVLPAGNGTVVRRLSNIVHFGGEDMGGALALLLLLVAVAAPVLTILATGRSLRSLS